MNPSNDVLDVDGLPKDPREMALRLLGMTAAELKGIDEKVVSGRSSVGGTRADFTKIVNDFNNNLRPNMSMPVLGPQPIPQQIPPVQQPVQPQVLQPSTNGLHAVTPNIVTEPQEDKSQLEFDFYKKIKPEDLEYQLRLLNKEVAEISRKVDIVFDYLKKNYPVVNASQSQ